MLRRTLAVTTFLLAGTTSASAQDYTFDLLYLGGGATALAAGSDEPIGTNVLPGQSYFERLTATGGNVWTVIDGGGTFFLPLAFSLNETASRTGNYTINVFNGATQVATFSQLGVSQTFVHMGAESVTLADGLVFDRLELDYELLTAQDGGGSTGSTINGRLFFAPENALNGSGDIVYGPSAVVPEPGTTLLVLSGLGLLGLTARRARRA